MPTAHSSAEEDWEVQAEEAVSGVWPQAASRWLDTVAFELNELRNILSGLTPNLDWLEGICKEDLPRRDVLESIEDMKESCRRLARLCRETSMVAKGEVLLTMPEATRFDELLRESVHQAQGILGHRAPSIELIAGPEVLIEIDRTLVSRALQRMLHSALSRTVSGSSVVVSYTVLDETLSVSIFSRPPNAPLLGSWRPVDDSARRAVVRCGQECQCPAQRFCQAVAVAHGGKLSAREQLGGGVRCVLSLPLRPSFDYRHSGEP